MDVTDLNELLDVRCVKIENNFDGSNDHGESSDPLSVIPSFSDNDLSTEILQTPLTVFSDTVDEDTMQSTDSGDEVLVQLMDIRTQLSKLRIILERRLGVDLSDYDFWLQDAKKLEPHKTLVEQCIRGEGVVQVNVQITPRSRKINILDVLKPDEEIVQLPQWNEETSDQPTLESIEPEPDECYEAIETVETVCTSAVESVQEREESGSGEKTHAAAVKWVVDEHFRSELARIRIPDDPADWTALHVKLWIQWAVRQFNLTGIKLSNWNINGQQLYAMTNQEFKERVPNDPGDRFWTHFALLRKCKFIAVVENDEVAPYLKDSSQLQTIKKKKPRPAAVHRVITGCTELPPGQMLKSGQIQLWQFLLDLLTTVDYYHIIRWHGKNGEFKLLKPELVARLWGIRKKKPAMNYEKLSRALRYYYDGDMIAKVPAKRFVYKFVCDLRQLIGYNASELADRVNALHYQRMMTPKT